MTPKDLTQEQLAVLKKYLIANQIWSEKPPENRLPGELAPMPLSHVTFIEELMKTGSITDSAVKAFGEENRAVAAKLGSRALRSPKVRKTLIEKLPDQLLGKRHTELLNKREVTKKIKKGQIILVDSPDTQAVSKALEMAYKIKGSFAPEKHVTVTASLADIIKQARQNKLDKKENDAN